MANDGLSATDVTKYIATDTYYSYVSSIDLSNVLMVSDDGTVKEAVASAFVSA